MHGRTPELSPGIYPAGESSVPEPSEVGCKLHSKGLLNPDRGWERELRGCTLETWPGQALASTASGTGSRCQAVHPHSVS